MSEPSHAVFLSYASQDAEAAQRIAEALRAVGIQVFLDQSELRGGDTWDRKIRHEIHDCVLFIPIVSQHTQERLEGYFRHEWKLATERTHHMADEKAFLVPVVIDSTSDKEAIVPDLFRSVQWTRLPGGETPPAFIERVQRLLSPEASTTTHAPASTGTGAARTTRKQTPPSWRSKRALSVAATVVIAAVAGYVALDKLWISRRAAPTVAAPAAFAPPPHSIAVLPFVNMSGDKEQEYFSDGLTEELLNSLAEINSLQVAARTSSFYFKGKDADLTTIAHKLNVTAVLEGSVRRSANTVRITAQLINAVTGFHLWSKTYDRDIGDVLKLQTEIATAVASALKVTLLGDEAAKIELGGTHNPAAFDAYLRGSKAFSSGQGESSFQSAIARYTEAIRLDPNYALAFAYRSLALCGYAGEFANGTAIRVSLDKAQADAREALKLAPELAEGHVALAQVLIFGSLDYIHASEAYERAAALAPGNAVVLAEGARFAVHMGRFDAGLATARRAAALDPLNPFTRSLVGQALLWARRYQESVAAFGEVISLEPDYQPAYGYRGLAYYGLGDFQNARSSCETKPDYWLSQWCLTVAYDQLGRHADAQAELKKWQAADGDSSAYQYATTYAQWGDRAKALEWLDTAMRLHDPGLELLKSDPLMDPLRREPRFQAVMRELKFPD